jgi:glucose/arabinose dehydrogenase
MKRTTGAALLALITAGISPLASAQPAEQPETAAEPQAEPTAAAAAATPARKRPIRRKTAAALPRATGPVATFPGYHALPDGRTQVYVEITSLVAVAESTAPGTITYRLKGARVTVRNNKNALITTHFPATPVARARLVPADNDLNLIIELRANVTATYRMVSSETGTARLEVEFPAGQYPTEPLRFMPPVKDVAAKEPKALTGSDTVDNAPEKAPAADKPKKKTAKPKAKGMGPPVP